MDEYLVKKNCIIDEEKLLKAHINQILFEFKCIDNLTHSNSI